MTEFGSHPCEDDSSTLLEHCGTGTCTEDDASTIENGFERTLVGTLKITEGAEVRTLEWVNVRVCFCLPRNRARRLVTTRRGRTVRWYVHPMSTDVHRRAGVLILVSG